MDFILIFFLGTVISWLSLLIIIPLAQKIVGFSFPPWGEALWKLAIVAAAGNLVSIALGPINFWLSVIVGAIIFWTLLYKWFDVDLFGAIIIVVLSWIVRAILGGMLLAAMFHSMSSID